MYNSVEILAPAGNDKMLEAAVMSGANAVYLGLLNLNARSTAGNFTPHALNEAVAFCAARNVKVYVAINTIVHPQELKMAATLIEQVASSAANAVIVQDLAVAALVKKIAPTLDLHGSTQMSVHSAMGAKRLKDIGFKRVILSRELSLGTISDIVKDTDIEIETFVHGALCMSVSGQCYMSAFFGGRSANRGACAGPCRLPFSSLHNTGAIKDDFHLSLKDMSHVHALPKLAQAGVKSVKIEGRLRTPEYVAAAVNACKMSLDNKPYDMELLQDVFSRSGFTSGYLDASLTKDMFGVRTQQDASATRAAMPKLHELYRREAASVPVTMKLEIDDATSKLAVCDMDGNMAVAMGDEAPAVANSDRSDSYIISLSKTGGTPFYVSAPADIVGGSFYLSASQINKMRREALEKLLEMRSKLKSHVCNFTAQEAVKDMLHSDDIDERYLKSAGDVYIDSLKNSAKSAKKLFVFLDKLEQLPSSWQENMAQNTGAINSSSEPGAPDAIILPLELWQEVPLGLRKFVYLALPRFCATKRQEEQVSVLVAQSHKSAEGEGGASFKGYYVDNMAHVEICKGLPMMGGFGLNVSNAVSAAAYAAMGVDVVTMSLELTAPQMALAEPQMHVKHRVKDLFVAGQDAPTNDKKSKDESAQAIKSAVAVYGHMPLMMTYACPMLNAWDCGTCKGEKTLCDRKGAEFYVKACALFITLCRFIWATI